LLIICIEIIARCMLVALFLPFSALDKVLNFKQAVGQASQAAANRGLAAALITAGLCIEVVMSAAILTGIADRLAALILAAYCARDCPALEAILEKARLQASGDEPRTGHLLGFPEEFSAGRRFSHAGIRQQCGRRSSVSGCAPRLLAPLRDSARYESAAVMTPRVQRIAAFGLTSRDATAAWRLLSSRLRLPVAEHRPSRGCPLRSPHARSRRCASRDAGSGPSDH
jgi:putative oxidoreductase